MFGMYKRIAAAQANTFIPYVQINLAVCAVIDLTLKK